MALVTKVRQDPQIYSSDTYTDSTAPSLANFETNPVHLEDDLNNIRSQLHNFLNVQTGNWYDDLVTPSALESGAQRGINDLNSALHAVEKKRVLRCVYGLNSISIAGAGDTFDILGTGELPGNTTAALGAVTTLGTVVAAHGGTFGTHSLAEVAGSTAISPKNLVQIVNSTTRDPILDGQDRIYGLLQAESGLADGGTITDTTTTRVQISFVKVSGNDLVAISSGAMDGVTYDYCYTERVRLEDLNEADFLGGANVDVPAGSTVTRQVGYDNQGTTPVDLTTNATLDLEGAGLTWAIRDDLEAELFAVVEGSAGGTSQVRIAAGVDTFNVDAVANDFANGASFDTSGTAIQVAETAGVIERAADLRIYASGASAELLLDDSFLTAEGTWTGPGVPLSASTAEVADYVTNFGDGTSLMEAINTAFEAGADPTFTRAVLGANVAADADVGGPGTAANNLDVNLPDGMTVGTFTDNHALYYNGVLLRPGANAAANQDYYPGTTFTPGDVEIKFEDNVKSGDQITVWIWP